MSDSIRAEVAGIMTSLRSDVWAAEEDALKFIEFAEQQLDTGEVGEWMTVAGFTFSLRDGNIHAGLEFGFWNRDDVGYTWLGTETEEKFFEFILH